MKISARSVPAGVLAFGVLGVAVGVAHHDDGSVLKAPGARD